MASVLALDEGRLLLFSGPMQGRRADGRLFVLEVNANPLIGEYSVMATMAEKMGWPFARFIHTIAVEAYRRFQRESRAVTLRKLPPEETEESRAAAPARKP